MLANNQVLQLDRYRIIKQLEADRTGTIYEAYDADLKTNVLLKEITLNLGKVVTTSQIDVRKLTFASEAKVLTEIKHQSLLEVQGYFSEIDRQYLVLESVEGQSLFELIEKHRNPAALKDLINWADQLLDVIHCLHTRPSPIIHCDINPQNIKLTSDGKIKLLALDIAKKPEERASAIIKNQDSSSFSLHYLPLEQIWIGLDRASKKVILNSYDEKSEKILEQPADARSDIYALGATLYHLATARRPIDALERSIDILEGKPDPLPPPKQLNSNIPSEVSDVLMKALEIRRENRFSSATIMRQILRTSIAHPKERRADEPKRQEISSNPNNFVSQKNPEIRIQFAKPEKLPLIEQTDAEKKSEIEQRQRIEIIEKQLREAEALRIEAERRAAAAESLLREKESQQNPPDEIIILDGADLLVEESVESAKPEVELAAVPIEIGEIIEPVSHPKSKSIETAKPDVIEKKTLDDSKELFALPENDNKNFKRILLATAALLIIGSAAGLGIWNFSMRAESPAAQQTIPAPAGSSSDAPKPEPSIQTTPIAPVAVAADNQAVSETTPETSSQPEASMPLINPAEVKNKPLAPQQQTAPKIKKQEPSALKTPPPAADQKKPVTVEDIINDN